MEADQVEAGEGREEGEVDGEGKRRRVSQERNYFSSHIVILYFYMFCLHMKHWIFSNGHATLIITFHIVASSSCIPM